MNDLDCKNSRDLVRQEYKRYKRRSPPPDFKEVVDFHNPCMFLNLVKKKTLHNVKISPERFCRLGLHEPCEWKVYELASCPGFLVVVNPFKNYGAQSHWVKQCLTEYTRKPFPCNLDALMELDQQKTMWDISKNKSSDNKFINQLRWTHMGYHFDYNVVDYKSKKYFGFPADLSALTETIAEVFEFPDYVAETGIINYYPQGSSMGGHTDHYEEELRQPLISYSFGQPAVYLIGGKTRDIKPEAIWVRSGDIMLMTGQSRTAFHAVPCIATKPVKGGPPDIGGRCPLVTPTSGSGCLEEENSCECCHSNGCHGDMHVYRNAMLEPGWNEFSEYISNTRINVNIRQVHKHVPLSVT